MNENLKRQLDAAVKSIEARTAAEKSIVLVIVLAGLVLGYLSLVFDPMRNDIQRNGSQISNVTRQIQAQETAHATMVEASLADPNKFANDRLAVISSEQAQLQLQIEGLAGDLVTPNDMTRILTSLLQRQEGLEFVHIQNRPATPLRSGVTNADELLAERGAVNFADVTQANVSGQVYEHGLTIEFEGDFFNTLKYLRYLEDISGSFFWDEISFRQLEWPKAHVTLEIHTLSAEQGFIGV